jgi:hypothetical protein
MVTGRDGSTWQVGPVGLFGFWGPNKKHVAFAIFSLRSEVLIGKTAEDNDRLSLQYGKPDEALSTRTAAYRDLHMF